MNTLTKIEELRAYLASSDSPLGLVPTMGALHEGHLSLMRAARQDCKTVVVSIFVNPMQFGPSEDYTQYPRPLDEDLRKCRDEHVDVVFCPQAQEMYGGDARTVIHVKRVSETLCGKSRPGHFEGVATVVAKLFNIVQPSRAYFGQKDAQQVAVIRKMAKDLNFPVDVVVCPTVREPDGLAMSSRNAYLNPTQRQQATCLYRALQFISKHIESGEHSTQRLQDAAQNLIREHALCRVDYIMLVDPATMQPIEQVTQPVLAAGAMYVGSTRLIDNLLIDTSSVDAKASP